VVLIPRSGEANRDAGEVMERAILVTWGANTGCRVPQMASKGQMHGNFSQAARQDVMLLATLVNQGKKRMSASSSSSQLHLLSVVDAAAAIRDGSLNAVDYVAALLLRCRENADLKAFITLDEESILKKAHIADLDRKSNKPLGLLHGVPIAIKDSINTKDTATSLGTKVLAGFRPKHDATVISPIKAAGAILFGKNNLVEMSYGLTGANGHYGQARNPYDKRRITGGSSSGAGASVAARLVAAALGGDTVGSIRVPASLCGIVGFRPTTGRWPGSGVAPISHTFDTLGPMARTVEDCALLDAVVTGGPHVTTTSEPDLKGVRIGYAPKQHLDLIDADVERAFKLSIEKLKDSGAELIEIDLGEDFMPLALQANWPIFWHETMPHIKEYLEESDVPVTFQEIYEGLEETVKTHWNNAVLPDSPNYVSKDTYLDSLNVHRPLLQKRYAESYRSNGIEVLVFPTTPAVAPPVGDEVEITIAGQVVSILTIAKNVFASSCAGLPGITLPIGVSSDGMPIGMEIDGKPNKDARLLSLATRISAIVGKIPAPAK
jgi:indoleacetamide hydrolase